MSSEATRTPALLSTRGLSAGYLGHAAVHDLDIEVRSGEVVALMGPNGAGKTTTLRTLAGDLAPVSGDVLWAGESIDTGLHQRARSGLSFVTEERSVFMRLSVAENIRIGRCDVEAVMDLFPELRPMLGRPAGSLSGGEQQMLTLGRALARHPKVLLADELSLGLAPLLVKRLLGAVRAAADNGLAAIIVEQQVNHALRYADRAYVMRRGEVVLAGPADEVASRMDDLADLYL
jgi:branched-chain amino acid transport system ATP-binding protein